MNDFKQYVTFLHDEREANNRYVQQVKSLENLCKVHNIELCMFSKHFMMLDPGIHNANDNTTFKDYINKEYINDDREKQRLGMEQSDNWHYGNELTKTRMG